MQHERDFDKAHPMGEIETFDDIARKDYVRRNLIHQTIDAPLRAMKADALKVVPTFKDSPLGMALRRAGILTRRVFKLPPSKNNFKI